MNKPQLVSLGSLNRLLQAAEKAVQDRDFAQATELAERAQRFDPANVQLLLYLGQIHCRNYAPEKAWQTFERAARVSAKPAPVLLEAGRCAVHFGQYEIGERCFETAGKSADATPEVFAEWAGVLERLRRLDEADFLVDKALQMAASCADARLVRARLLRQRGKLEEAEALLRPNLVTMEKRVRVRAEYELGNICDRLGRFDEAMTAFQNAKKLLQPEAKRATHELQMMRKRLTLLKDSLNREILDRWLATSAQFATPRPVALLGGHPRSGTTLLEQVLDAHPGIISAEETHVFYDEAYKPLARPHQNEQGNILKILEAAALPQLEQSRARYFERMKHVLHEPVGNRLLIDKNPSLTFIAAVFIRVFPEAKFLIALRDPRDVCMSCFMQPLPVDQVSSAWLTLEGTVNEYVEMMGMWLAMRPHLTERALEVRYEDLVAGLEPVARKTLDFLGVAWDPKVLGFDEHARQKAVRSPTYSDVTKKVFKTAVGRWRNYQKYFEPHLAKLEPLVKELGYE